MGYYDVIREFTEGYVAGITTPDWEFDFSDHKIAGWNAGYAARKEKNAAIDKYLISIGQRSQAIVKVI